MAMRPGSKFLFIVSLLDVKVGRREGPDRRLNHSFSQATSTRLGAKRHTKIGFNIILIIASKYFDTYHLHKTCHPITSKTVGFAMRSSSHVVGLGSEFEFRPINHRLFRDNVNPHHTIIARLAAPSTHQSPDRRHYIIQKAKAATHREREIGEPLVFTHRSPLFPPSVLPTTTRYCQTAMRPWPYMHHRECTGRRMEGPS